MITQFLFANKDEEYKRFSSSLIPTIEPEKVIGVRTPVLRKFAKDIVGQEETESFRITADKKDYLKAFKKGRI